jgi:hypothetical protein
MPMAGAAARPVRYHCGEQTVIAIGLPRSAAMLGLLRDFFAYWAEVFRVIGLALAPSDGLYALLAPYTRELLVYVPGVAFIAGASLLLGQSVILFLNRAGPARFALSLLIRGVFFTVGLLLTGAVLWLTGSLLFDRSPALSEMLALTALSYGPLAFGFLILIPFFGIAIERLLYIWVALLLVAVVRSGFGASLPTAVLCVGLAYVVQALLSATLGRPLIAARNAVLRRVVGSDDLSPTPAEIRDQVSRALAATPRGDQQ